MRSTKRLRCSVRWLLLNLIKFAQSNAWQGNAKSRNEASRVKQNVCHAQPRAGTVIEFDPRALPQYIEIEHSRGFKYRLCLYHALQGLRFDGESGCVRHGCIRITHLRAASADLQDCMSCRYSPDKGPPPGRRYHGVRNIFMIHATPAVFDRSRRRRVSGPYRISSASILCTFPRSPHYPAGNTPGSPSC